MKWSFASFLAGVLVACVCLAVVLRNGTLVLLVADAKYTASGVQSTRLISSDAGLLSVVRRTAGPGHSDSSVLESLLHDKGTPAGSSSRSKTSSSESYTASSSIHGHSTIPDAGNRRQLQYQGGAFSGDWKQEYGNYKSRWHPTVFRSVFKAQQQLTTTREERAGRLFVPMLSSRHSELCCMLTDMNAKLGATNKLDVFIFTIDNKAQALYHRSPCWNRKMNITTVFMALDEHWGVDPRSSSSAIHDIDGWVGLPGLFGHRYRSMGHWRLTFQFAFADMLGYKYVWQLDDDSFFKSPVDFDVIQYMQQHDLWVAGHKTLPDPHFVTWGLPEMARLYLVGERIAPTGTLFSNHTQPPGLEGLYTVRNDSVRTQHPLEGDPGGWSRTIIHGNCMIMDMDKFWWSQEAQKFVELAVQSGYHWRFRWNEQGIMAMLWQMFVPEGHYQFDTLPIDYHHPRKVWGQCPDSHVAQSV